ncbi:MAG TPA: hypothetical protein VK843_18815 [Planctomycetota bacterium]|nr:hypothetical protein [Planctomycetota bacterium]
MSSNAGLSALLGRIFEPYRSQNHRLPDFVVETVTNWTPEVDVAIDASSFEYQVPRARQCSEATESVHE